MTSPSSARPSVLTLCLLALFVSGVSSALAQTPFYVPESLKPWQPWVLHKNKYLACPPAYNANAERTCAWPTRLELTVTATGAKFALSWQVFTDDWLVLPGDSEHWPRDVVMDGTALAVAKHDDRPAAYVSAGIHRIQGTIAWTKRPESLRIPRECGLVGLTLDGKIVPNPSVDDDGSLFFGVKASGEEAQTPADEQDIKVFRKIIDDVPVYVESQVRLMVSGRDRELLLGRFLPERATVTSLESGLPARVEKDGALRVQARAGTWTVTLRSRQEGFAADLCMHKATDLWPSQEVWVFEANPGLRSVSIKGVAPIDPQQTELPSEWKQLPAFLVTPADTFRLAEEYRGDFSPSPNQLDIKRAWWLDFDGKGFTVSDRISGSVTRRERLCAQPGFDLGRIELDGRPQLITAMKGEKAGIELQQGSLNLAATSRFEMRGLSIPATGWAHDFSRVSGEVNLPPGWSLFHVGGVDSVSDSWVSRWSLWDFFLLFIIAVAAARLLGVKWGVLCLVSIALCYHEDGAPLFSWLNLIAASALFAMLPAGKFRRILVWYRALSYVLVACLAVAFSVTQIGRSIYPQLEYRNRVNPVVHEYYSSEAQPATSAYKKLMGRHASDKINEETHLVSLTPQAAPHHQKSRNEFGAGGAPLAGSELGSDADIVPLDGGAPPTGFGGGTGFIAGKSVQERTMQVSQQYDTHANIQTGPGEPTWVGRQVSFSWHGPVDQAQRVSFVMMPPPMNRLLNLLRVVFVLCLLYGFISHDAKQRLSWKSVREFLHPVRGAARAMAVLLVLCVLVGPSLGGEYPSEEMLKELENRMIEPSSCFPECASIVKADVRIAADQIAIDVVVDALANVAVPLLGKRQAWSLQGVTVNGAPAGALRQADDGALWCVLKKGRSTVTLRGRLEGTGVSIPIPLEMHNLSASAAGWQCSGIVDGALPGGSLILNRNVAEAAQGAKTGTSLLPDPIPFFVEVTRRVCLANEWSVQTFVRRIAPNQGAVNITFPLMKGESVVTAGAADSAGSAKIVLTADQQEFTWLSTLKRCDTLVLSTPEQRHWVERWELNASPDWHVEHSGLAAVKQSPGAGNQLPVWKPRPGEVLRLAVTKPQAVAGNTQTIESVSLSATPGKRLTDVELSLSVRSSQAGKLTIGLPNASELKQVQIDERDHISSLKNGSLDIPLHPGRQRVRVTWKEKIGIGLLGKTPAVKLNERAVNVDMSYSLPHDRWPLLLGGPAIGPAMLMWGILIVLLLASWALGKLDFLPVKHWQWFLLFLGMSTIRNFGGVFVLLWFLALSRRSIWSTPTASRYFNTVQVLLILLTLAAAASLVATVPISLLSSPDMQIVGNGSSTHQLLWYQDRSSGPLPTGWVVSLPLWSYRIVMLLWSFWIAFLASRWVKWGWNAFTQNGIWAGRRRAMAQGSLPEGPASGSH